MLILCNTHEIRAGLPMPKFALRWEGAHVVKQDVGKGCYELATIEEDSLF